MATKGAHKRLTKEYITIAKSPPDYIVAKPLESNILEWHYVIRGPPDSVYAGGEYHGKVIFPSDYPFKPPSIKMLTPNGRFQTDYKLCLSMSDYHPKTWNPAWSVSTILTGLLSFMLEDAPTTGSIKTTTAEKRVYAQKSHAVNLANARFKEVFPELCTPELAPLPNAPTTSPAAAAKPSASAADANASSPATGGAAASTAASPTAGEVRRRVNNTAADAAAAAGTTPAAAAPAAPATAPGPVVPPAAVVVASLWNNVRSNIWRSLLLGVLVYLVVLKIFNRLAEQK
ncbi:Ubiquitin-conjugating enzyme E2 6 [Geranomyces variabilis]|uniref:Ubiquitin-conjugating enzyme E2 6 n=1 Tax=Geranomyces variabilis TaxID=109894 RepID=A0AAD5TH66_9FUNG|nr:Ubiquitin-conjugating enzyme E2 6 [Geranomyces variabilis]